jgi:hypothetical protein
MDEVEKDKEAIIADLLSTRDEMLTFIKNNKAINELKA